MNIATPKPYMDAADLANEEATYTSQVPKATTPAVRYPDIYVQLIGQNGNALVLIGLTAAEIRRQVGPDEASEFTAAAIKSESYDDLLTFIMQTVNVT